MSNMFNQSKTLIIPSQLRVAREDMALELKEVAAQLKVEAKMLESWEKGQLEPSLEQVYKLAKLYGRGVDYFLKQVPVLPKQLSFRITARNTVRELPIELRRVLMRFDELCRAESELEALFQKHREILVERASDGRGPEELANSERLGLRLGDLPIKDLRGLLTRLGIRIFELPIPENGLAGLAWWHKEYGPCILVNALDRKGRRCFTLAHEYAHLIRYEKPTLCDLKLDTGEERFATRFAAFFLMPTSGLKRDFNRFVGPPGTLPSDEQLGELAAHYNVSLEALGRRLEEIGFLREGTTNSRIVDWEKKQKHYGGASGPRWRRQLGEKFVSLAFDAYTEGHISLATLAHYIGKDIRTAFEATQKPNKAGESKAGD